MNGASERRGSLFHFCRLDLHPSIATHLIKETLAAFSCNTLNSIRIIFLGVFHITKKDPDTIVVFGGFVVFRWFRFFIKKYVVSKIPYT